MKNNKKSLLKAGYVSKAHGVKGEIFIRPFNPQPEWPHPLKTIIIGSQVFSVQKYSRHKGGMIFNLDQSETRETAEALKGQTVFLPEKLFVSLKGERIYLAELLSFRVELLAYGELGKLDKFRSFSGRDFLCVRPKGAKSEILIPFVGPYIQEIRFSQKKLILNLPKAFLESFC